MFMLVALFLGMFLDGVAIVLPTMPVVFPVAYALKIGPCQGRRRARSHHLGARVGEHRRTQPYRSRRSRRPQDPADWQCRRAHRLWRDQGRLKRARRWSKYFGVSPEIFRCVDVRHEYSAARCPASPSSKYAACRPRFRGRGGGVRDAAARLKRSDAPPPSSRSPDTTARRPAYALA